MRTLFFFNEPATTDIYTLSLHDALPIYRAGDAPVPAGAQGLDEHLLVPDADAGEAVGSEVGGVADTPRSGEGCIDRKSTRLNSSHSQISYAVFCLKKKKKSIQNTVQTQ